MQYEAQPSHHAPDLHIHTLCISLCLHTCKLVDKHYRHKTVYVCDKPGSAALSDLHPFLMQGIFIHEKCVARQTSKISLIHNFLTEKYLLDNWQVTREEFEILSLKSVAYLASQPGILTTSKLASSPGQTICAGTSFSSARLACVWLASKCGHNKVLRSGATIYLELCSQETLWYGNWSHALIMQILYVAFCRSARRDIIRRCLRHWLQTWTSYLQRQTDRKSVV